MTRNWIVGPPHICNFLFLDLLFNPEERSNHRQKPPEGKPRATPTTDRCRRGRRMVFERRRAKDREEVVAVTAVRLLTGGASGGRFVRGASVGLGFRPIDSRGTFVGFSAESRRFDAFFQSVEGGE